MDAAEGLFRAAEGQADAAAVGAANAKADQGLMPKVEVAVEVEKAAPPK